MLELNEIRKDYPAGSGVVHALKGVSLRFRESEFVSILGPSGCGKTTLLNIIGGLDHYTSGDLIINGRSTKDFKDRDWDTYRNHSIGFVFQSYHLIPHQSVLQNVEMALTLSGVGKAERRERARKALAAVGLSEQVAKRPSEMSGGQMQRVAIARALVNDPDIILADEPTGALDTETSVQVMDLLKEISRERLVIMVTHNPELAEQYSTRIIRILDGEITGDSDPVGEKELAELAAAVPAAVSRSKEKKPSMSFATAFGLSLKNLFTKKGRTALTSFAGSIGIIGIALIFSVSQGTNDYIDKVQENTLSTYPLSILSETADMTTMLTAMGSAVAGDPDQPERTVSERRVMSGILAQVGTNDLSSFKKHLDAHMDEVGGDLNALQYGYGVTPQIYTRDLHGELLQVNPSTLFSSMMGSSAYSSMMSAGAFSAMLDNRELLESQYDVLAGRWPESYDEILLVLGSDDGISDFLAYSIGLRDPQELKDMIAEVMKGNQVESAGEPMLWTYDELLALEFRLIEASGIYRYNEDHGVWENMSDDEAYMQELYENSEALRVTGIVCPKKGVAASAMSPGFAYTPELTAHLMESAAGKTIVRDQLADRERDVFTGRLFSEDEEEEEPSGLNFEDMISVDTEMLSDAFGIDVSEEDITALTTKYMGDISGAITTDIAPAQTAFLDTLSDLARGMFTDYLARSADPVTGMAMLDAGDADAIVSEYLAGKTARTALAALEQEFVVPAAAMEQVYTPLLKGLITGYVAGVNSAGLLDPAPSDPTGGMTLPEGMTLPGSTTPSETPALSSVAPLTAAAVEPTIENYTSNALVVGTAATMGGKMTEAVMQKTILTSVGELMGKVTGSLAEAFHVDEEKIAQAFRFNMGEDELRRLMEAFSGGSTERTADLNLSTLGYADAASPLSISVYLKDFDSKEHFIDFLENYNDEMERTGHDEQVISYSDITGVLMSSVTTIINAITYVLIAFVAISLVVSSIMIGVITLISVQERTKEIGILRALGASKRNVSSMFNAETVIIGFTSGALGVLITYLLCIPINAILHKVTGISTLSAHLPVPVAIILVLISMFLTLIAGIIPSRSAAKKDPVVALRTE